MLVSPGFGSKLFTIDKAERNAKGVKVVVTNLLIRNVTKADGKDYNCRLTGPNGREPFSKIMTLEVFGKRLRHHLSIV